MRGKGATIKTRMRMSLLWTSHAKGMTMQNQTPFISIAMVVKAKTATNGIILHYEDSVGLSGFSGKP